MKLSKLTDAMKSIRRQAGFLLSPGRFGGGGGGGGGGGPTWGVTLYPSNSEATSHNINPGAAAGDYLIAYAISDSSASGGTTFTFPAGFTVETKVVCTADAQTMTVATKIATGAEGSMTISGNTGIIAGFIKVTGGNASVQPDVAIPAGSNNSTAQASPFSLTAAITPVTNNNLLVAIAGWDLTTSAAGAGNTTFSDTGGLTWTKLAELGTGGQWERGAAGYAQQAVAGATTVTASCTYAGVSAGRTMFVISVRP